MDRKDFSLKEFSTPLLIRGGEYWDSKKKEIHKGDLIIEKGIIKRIVPFWDDSFNGQVINASGRTILPGLFDMHVHFREPGFEYKETIETGCRAATAGGFTGVCPMPNTKPVIDNGEMVRFIIDKAQPNLTEVYPIGAVTKGEEGDTLAEIGSMAGAGAVGISDDGRWVENSKLMRLGLEYSRMFSIPVISHSLDEALSENGVMNEGYYSTKLGLQGLPSVAEECAVFRDIRLARYTGGRLHIAHVSTKSGLELIRQAKNDGFAVTTEVTPMHLCLTEEKLTGYNPNFKLSPPLRTDEDTEAMIEGILDGTIDAIVTDHAPHAIDEKELEIIHAPFGCIGMETSFEVIYTAFIKDGTLSFERAIELFVEAPRSILQLDIPSIRENNPVNMIIIDLNNKHTVNAETFYSKGRNCPFEGMEVWGRIEGTILNKKGWLHPEAEALLLQDA